jgi:inositol monophosphatase 3
MESHKAIVHGFHYLFPSVTVVSEEHDHGDAQNHPVDINMSDIINISNDLDSNKDEQVAANDVLVWVDPLDATQEYTENLVKYVTTMVCIVVKGMP